MAKDRISASELAGPLSPTSMDRLGLPSQTDVRVVSRSGRTILLEAGDGSGFVVPGDRDLVLSCDVRAFTLADLLSLVHRTGKSGYLLFEQGDEEKAIFLSRGEVVFAQSSLLSDRLGEHLLRAGLIDQDQLEAAESRYHPGTRFGKIVVEMGFLTPKDLWGGVKSQVEEIVRSLFSYTSGWIHFWEGEIEPDNVVRLSLPTNRLIEEGLARRDELLLFLGRLEDSRTRIHACEQTRPPASENEREIIDALEEEERFSGLCHRSGLDPRTAARTIQQLYEDERVSLDEESSANGAEFSTADDDVVREAIALHGKLILELSAPLVAIDGPEAVSERLNRVREESAASGRALLDGVRFNSMASLDPDELEHRALRLPGDRVRQIDEALGEIVAYLEFELKNHPQIEDSAPYLEAVDPLRAMLIR